MLFVLLVVIITAQNGIAKLNEGSLAFAITYLAVACFGVVVVVIGLAGKWPDVFAAMRRLHPRRSSESDTVFRGWGPAAYVPPAVCPACGVALSEESIEWVGPLKVRCSHCGTVADAVKTRVSSG
ncbi:MAG: hypothetical protein DRO73_01395 [Candidatus Thorarchaeota archaeon]|nr:MAG: hypothetical protein DRO73_01395 [Candidatus Thorarchaeota archaeon]